MSRPPICGGEKQCEPRDIITTTVLDHLHLASAEFVSWVKQEPWTSYHNPLTLK